MRHSSAKGLLCLVLAALGSLVFSPVANAALTVDHLRCEYLSNPLGIDELHPRLSWVLESNVRAEVQNSYQILVASTREKLDANVGDLWDSGRVDSDHSIQVPYAGKPLLSRQTCFWKIRAWGREAKSSSY